jgi:hypothetical protein
VERVLEVCGEAMAISTGVAPAVAETIPHARDIIGFRNISFFPNPRRDRISPAFAPAPRITTTSGWSTARRSGPAAPSSDEILRNIIGLGLGPLEALLVIEEFAKISGAVAFPVFESCTGPIKAIEKYGSESLKARIVPASAAVK